MKVLALSGSLRRNSYNTAVLEALKEISPNNVDFHIGRIDNLPLFNPDLEETHLPAVDTLKLSLSQASGLVIASPEYAHGISGPMKNALDWLVGGTEFPYKPVMIINTSPRATHAVEALKEVLNTMSAVIIERAYVSVPLLSSGLDKDGILQNDEISGILKARAMDFYNQIKGQ